MIIYYYQKTNKVKIMETQKSLIVAALYASKNGTTEEKLEFPNIQEVFNTLKQKDNLIAFCYSSIETVTENGKTFVSEPQAGKNYIIGLSKPITKGQLQRMGPEGTILATKLDQYGYSMVVKTRKGTIPAKKGTIVLDTDFNQIHPVPRVQQPQIER